MKKILFISHEASLTGAPILLLNFLKWFKGNSNLEFIVLIRNNGPLKREFEKLSLTYVFEDFYRIKTDLKSRLKNKIFSRIQQPKNTLKNELLKQNIGLIFSNTLTNGDIIEKIDLPQMRMITYAHELEIVIKNFASKLMLETTLKKTSFFLTGSEAVRQNLILNHGISGNRIKVVYSYIPFNEFKNGWPPNFQLKAELQIPSESIVIGGIGRGLWRKGVDVFLNVAKILINCYDNKKLVFIWVGIDEGDEYNMVLHDAEMLNIKDKITFIHTKENIKDYFSLFDIFLLTSREDPFPVVVMEAAALKIPVICFEHAGGIPEFTADKCGISVPYLDVQAMADQVISFVQNPLNTDIIKENAYNKVRDFHDVEYAGPIIKSHIEMNLSEN